MRTLSQLTLLAAASASLHASGLLDAHPSGNPTSNTYLNGVAPDGLTGVGSSNIVRYLGSACTIDASGFHDLGLGDGSYAMGISANGTVVGTLSSTGLDRAFKFSGGTATQLGDFGFGTSNALAISRDGSTIVGNSFDTVAEVAFKWTSGGGMVAITPLPVNA
jgi:probable HAF family extracellular repeat protein